MERYIEQLIEDMREVAQDTHATETGHNVDHIEGHLAYVEEYLHGPGQKLSQIVGIDKVQLPVPDKLSSDQKTKLYHEMVSLLKAYHFVPDFPEGLPEDIRYDVLHNEWDREEVMVSRGEVHIEFCTYYPDDCPFPQAYCACRQFEEEDDDGGWLDDEFTKGEDLPF